jgi:hypothetical protein
MFEGMTTRPAGALDTGKPCRMNNRTPRISGRAFRISGDAGGSGDPREAPHVLAAPPRASAMAEANGRWHGDGKL